MDVNGKKILIWASIGGLPLFLMTFALFISVFLVLGLFESKASDSNNGNVAYDSDCNYEETMVTVMDGSNTHVLATVSLKDYIIGVACVEIGACGGASSSIAEHYVKSQYVASKTYVLSSRGYNSTTKSITVRASTRNQQWCDLKTGCIVTKESNSIYHNTYPGNYDESKINGSIIARRSFTEEDIKVFNQYYTDTYGDLFLNTNYNKTVTSLGSKDAVYYKASTQNFWNSQAKNGKIYDDILKNTASSGASDSSHYAGKSVYKLGNYCKSTSGSSSSSISFVKWMIDFAADDRHGYSMSNRTMNPDVDCSSFVYYALLNNGYTKQQLGGYPFATATMPNILTSIGFEQIPYEESKLQEGDIVWHPAGFNGHKYGHTEVYVGNGKNVGAHTNRDGKAGDSSGTEVNVGKISRKYKSIFRLK